MKTLFTFVFCLFTCHCKSQGVNEVRAAIQSLESRVAQAILVGDTSILKELWSPEFIVNTPRNNIAKDRAAVFQKQQAGLINYSQFNRNIEMIHINGDIAITMGSENLVSRTAMPGAKAGEVVKRRFTNIWTKRNGNWIQIARHASIICAQ